MNRLKLERQKVDNALASLRCQEAGRYFVAEAQNVGNCTLAAAQNVWQRKCGYQECG